MGVSIYYTTPRGKEVEITPGWRSTMHSICLDRCLYGMLSEDDIQNIKSAAKEQQLGESDHPFDWSEDIQEAFYKIVDGILKYKFITLEYSA